MPEKRKILILFAVGLCLSLFSCSKKEPKKEPETCEIIGPAEHAFLKAGPIGKGILLPNGLSITPYGQQLKVGAFPVNLIITPDDKFLIAVNIGRGLEGNPSLDYRDQSLAIIDIASQEISKIPIIPPYSLYLGLVVTQSGDGYKLYAAGGDSDKIIIYQMDQDGNPTPDGSIDVPDGYPAGLALSADENTLYVAENLKRKVALIDLSLGEIIKEIEVGEYPYWVTIHHQKNKGYVSNWGEGTVSVFDPDIKLKDITVGKNPEGMILSQDGERLYVANSDSDTISVIDTENDEVVDTLKVDFESDAPLGSSPVALEISVDGKLLFVSSAGTNSIDVISLEKGKIIGRIPTGWYPTGIAKSRDGSWLYGVNSKGEGGGPNLGAEYVGATMKGTLSFIPLSSARERLEELTKKVQDNNNRLSRYYHIPCDNPLSPIPSKPGGVSPIKHVVFILKENKTYDQVLGDFDRGEGEEDRERSLTMFGEWYTPNTHKLAREFTSLDNFYSDAEVSVQGHMWGTASICNDFMEKNWLVAPPAGSRIFLPGIEPAACPGSDFIFHNCLRHGIDFIVYGQAVGILSDYGLFEGYVDEDWPGGIVWSMVPKDEDRAKYFAQKLEEWDKKGKGFPEFVYMVLPNDHTYGLQAGKPTPESMVADNDLALGLVVESISHSRFWKDTAIFVTEDDPQSGADHVEAHRTICLIISPYARRNYTSHVHYSYPSIFKTMELILGLPPMNKYDERAAPMYDCFTTEPDLTPYTSLPRNVPEGFNPALAKLGALLAPLVRESERMDFSVPDSTSNHRMGEILWKYMKYKANEESKDSQ